jgi:hypothetical protein
MLDRLRTCWSHAPYGRLYDSDWLAWIYQMDVSGASGHRWCVQQTDDPKRYMGAGVVWWEVGRALRSCHDHTEVLSRS